MGRNLDKGGLDKRIEKPESKDSGSKTPKMDKIKSDTRSNISENFKK